MGLASQALEDKYQNWWRLACIQLAGGNISFPIIAIGSQMFLSNGITNAIISSVLGNFFILLVSLCFIRISSEERLNAIQNIEKFFGKKTGRILAFLILVSMLGWFAAQLFAGQAILELSPVLSKINICSLIGAVASLALLFGIKGLKVLCLICTVPLLILLGLIFAFVEPSIPNDVLAISNRFEISISRVISGASLVIAVFIASTVDYPTFFRHSISRKDSLIAVLLIFAVTIAIQICGIFLFSLFLVDFQTVSRLISVDSFISYTILSFIIISTVASVAWNVYAASVGWESLFPIFKDRTEYAVLGLVATVLFNAITIQEPLLFFIGLFDVMICGVSGPVVFIFFATSVLKIPELFQHTGYNTLCWFVASLIGLLTYFNIIFSRSYSTCISMIAGFIAACLIFGCRQVYRRFIHCK